MKKYMILGAVALAFSMTSCNDLLDKDPLDSFTDTPTYWNNADNLAYQCNYFYEQYSGYGNAGSGGWFYFKNLSDDQAGESFVNWTYTSVPSSSTTWKNAFQEIRRANKIIAGAESSTLAENVKNNYIGIARLNRAWQYYQLVRMYGNIQYIDYVLDIDDEALYGPRDDRDYVMDKVLEDLDFACNNITASGKKVFSKDLAYAMKAEVALFEGSFRKYRTAKENGKDADAAGAQKYFNECVKACEYLMAAGYALNDSYQGNYNSDNLDGNKEMIFFKQYAQNTLMHSTIDYTINTSGTNGITKDAFDSFLFLDGKPKATTSLDTDDAVPADGKLDKMLAVRDKRLAALIDPVVAVKGQPYSRFGSAQFTSSTGYGVAKYDNEEIPLTDRNNINKQYTDAPLFWYSVVLLEYAEAKAELGTCTQADLDKSVNMLLARAGVPAMTTSPEADPANDMNVSNLLWEIRRCRRCELMTDNWYRYWDLIRWHQLDKLDNSKNPDIALGANLKNMADNGGQTVNAEGYMETYFGNVRQYDAKYYYYPIPSGQILLNGQMKQNDGWDK